MKNQSTKMEFICRDLLFIPQLKDAVIRAGSKGLNRVITRVNIMEVPDVVNWVRPGEFLVTTGYPFRERPGEAFSELIPQLVEKGVAALGIKTKRFVDVIPTHILELAEKFDFPIIELPLSTVFSDLVREVMESVLAYEARYLSILQDRFQKMSQMMLFDGRIEEFLAELEKMINNPVILLDSGKQAVLSPQAREVIKKEDLGQIWSELRKGREGNRSDIVLGERRIRVHFTKVNAETYRDSLLILLEWNQHFTLVDTLTLDRVSMLVRMELMNAHARKEVEFKYKDQFLQDWLLGRIMNSADLHLRAQASGFQIEAENLYNVVIVRWNRDKPEVTEMHHLVHQLRHHPSHRMHSLFTLVEGELVFLLCNSHPEQLVKALEDIHAALIHAIQIDEESFSLCIGKTVPSSMHVYESYVQAKKVHHISEICMISDPWITYEHLGVYQVLYLLPECEEVREFTNRFIEPLLDYEQKYHTSLMDTVKAFFRHNGNIRKTAAELYTHYNTIVYRLERVRELTSIDFENENDRLQIQLALKLYEMKSFSLYAARA